MYQVRFRVLTLTLLVILVAAFLGVAGNLLLDQFPAFAGEYNLADQQAPLSPFGAAFTYQGYLTSGGLPADGVFDFEFSLFNAETAGVLLGISQAQDVVVSKGYFTVRLDFGPGVFNGSALWLAIGVRPGASIGNFTPLDPRQAITPAPYSNYAASAPWTGLQNVPSGFLDGVDNDTTYSAGSGLNLTNTQFGVDTSIIQARVASTCAPGSAIRVINIDGSVACDLGSPADISKPTYNRTPLDYVGDVGLHPSIAIGPDGLPLIAYVDGTNADLKLAHCENPNCTTAAITVLDTNGTYPSAILGADNRVLIVFVGGNGLVAAHCDDAACSSITKYPLFVNGTNPSLQLGSDGLGLFSFYTIPEYDLIVGHCMNVTCSSVNTYPLDSASNVTRTALTIGGDGLGLIAYSDGAPNNDLKIAHCTDLSCTAAEINTLDSASNVDIYLSIITTSDGFGLVVYDHIAGPSYPIKAAHCQNASCTAADINILAEDSQNWVMVTQAANGTGLIAYFTAEGLKIVYCTNMTCSGKSIYILDRNDAYSVGIMDIAIGADGLPVVAYTSKSLDLIAVHCDDIFCVP